MDENIGKIINGMRIENVYEERANDGHLYYDCVCITCGEHFKKTLSNLKFRTTGVCNHYIMLENHKVPVILSKEIPNKRLRHTFQGMIRRCYKEDYDDYPKYGAKGIRICDEWLDNPKLFYEWSIANGYTDDLTIDRKDSKKNYSPDNCRWVTNIENARFKDNTNYITAKVTLSGKQWASLIPERGSNHINRMVREKGIDNTVKYLEDRLCDKRYS